MHVAIIGAGIAGLATAWRLSEQGVSKITVLEREALPFSHSSARNAAIFRPLEVDPAVVRLVAHSEKLARELGAEPMIAQSGLLLTASQRDSLTPLLETAARTNVPHELVAGEALYALHPELVGGRTTSAIWLPEGGVMDIHRVGETLRSRLRAQQVDVRLNAEVARIDVRAGAVRGVVSTSRETLECDAVVVASGAWSQALGAAVGAPLTLTPHRRHLTLMLPTSANKLPSGRPVVWDMETGIYFRPESNGILGCPGDHEPVTAGVPQVIPQVLDTLAIGLPELCPALVSYAFVRSWACLRTMSPSRSMVIGADPRLRGLFWFAGLGGQGMSAGLGGADLLAHVIAGKHHELQHSTFGVEHHLSLEHGATA